MFFICLLFAQASSEDPYAFSCHGYTEFESQFPCGENGYAVSFGGKYCQIFLEKENSIFSPKGQEWSRYVRICLQQELEKILEQQKDLTCEAAATYATLSHVKCYTGGPISVCEIPRDWFSLAWTVKSAPFSAQWKAVWQTIVDVGKECFGGLVGNVFRMEFHDQKKSLANNGAKDALEWFNGVEKQIESLHPGIDFNIYDVVPTSEGVVVDLIATVDDHTDLKKELEELKDEVVFGKVDVGYSVVQISTFPLSRVDQQMIPAPTDSAYAYKISLFASLFVIVLWSL